MTYSEAGYEDYYDYGDDTGGQYTEEAAYEEYYEEDNSQDDTNQDPAPATAEEDLSEETTPVPEVTEEVISYTEEGERTSDESQEQISPAEPSTTVSSYDVSNEYQVASSSGNLMFISYSRKKKNPEIMKTMMMLRKITKHLMITRLVMTRTQLRAEWWTPMMRILTTMKRRTSMRSLTRNPQEKSLRQRGG